jgi:ATP-dependent Clp protease ATP-binding subunit ClpC
MFERFTEKARRTIFFARYEASQFGCSCIETEHLVLGVFREDKALANQFLASEAIRHSITQRNTTGVKVSTNPATVARNPDGGALSVDLPLSHESKRALVYAAEESERMNHKHIGTAHLLLGLLREEKSFGAQLLREQGLTLDLVREQAQQSEAPLAQSQSASSAGFDDWLAECAAPGGIWTVKCQRVANGTTHFAIYASDPPKENEKGED